MKRFVTFLAIGSFFATVEEFLTVYVLRHDVGSYLFTLIILFPVYLSVVYALSRIIDRYIQGERARELANFLIFGSIGLLLEWFLMGLAPWSNPDANPILMLIFQLGMFSFWTTVATAPRVFLDLRRPSATARRRILGFFVPFFWLVFVVLPFIPTERRFQTLIPLIIIAYLVVAGILIKWIVSLPGDAEFEDSVPA